MKLHRRKHFSQRKADGNLKEKMTGCHGSHEAPWLGTTYNKTPREKDYAMTSKKNYKNHF